MPAFAAMPPAQAGELFLRIHAAPSEWGRADLELPAALAPDASSDATPLRAGMIPPQLPGSPSYLQPGTPALAKFLLDLGYTTGEFGKNHLGDHTAALPTAHGFQEFWGYLYHLDAMQGVCFPDINSSPTVQAIVPPCQNSPGRGLSDPPGAVDPKAALSMAA